MLGTRMLIGFATALAVIVLTQVVAFLGRDRPGHLPAPRRAASFPGGGRRVGYRLRRLFELHDGRVTRLTVWPDLEPLAAQLA